MAKPPGIGNERRVRVLFLCTGNSARSQMAEAILRHLSKGAFEVHSAGTTPQPEIHPMARQAVRAVLNIDMKGQAPKPLDRFLGQQFDFIITVCDRAAESCPVFPGDPERLHWSYEDPAVATVTDEERQRAFEKTAREMIARMRLWLSLPLLRNRVAAAADE